MLGLCGGYQMLGAARSPIPTGSRGAPGAADGLGLLDVETVLGGDKTTVAVSGRHVPTGAPSPATRSISAHDRPGLRRPCSISMAVATAPGPADGLVAGSYVHGLFAADGFRRSYFAELGADGSDLRFNALVEETLDGLAAHLERHIDIDRLLAIASNRG